jgi:aldehyde:ferredoxin oxidoreductase
MKAQYGYMGKMLFVDLTNGRIHEEELTDEITRGYVGGYGIGVRVLYERMATGADPLGPDNILGIGTGPFTGCGVLSTSRFITMGKSPLTGFWGDANSGGNFPGALKAAGYDFVFFEGKADRPVYVLVTDEKVEIKDARHLWGKNVTVTEEMIRAENGNKKLKVACIGTGGERLARISAIMNDSGRAAARSGLGAVMGSKNVKALACAGSKRPVAFDKERVADLNKAMLKELRENPGPGAQLLTGTGTAGVSVPHFVMHAAPFKNFGGNNVDDWPESKWNSLSYEAMEKYIGKKYACGSCPVACGGILNIDDGPYALKNAHKPEYETVGAFGSNCLIDSVEAVIYANDLCNLHGLDTISAGATVAFAIECFENGLITTRDTDGLELRWGNHTAAMELLRKMCIREGVGDLFADGSKVAAQKIGQGSERFSMEVGGESIPMHDPREDNGWGATYVADPTPARHTRGGTQMVGNWSKKLKQMLNLPEGFDPFSYEGKGAAHALTRAYQHHINNTGLCLFVDSMMSYFPMLELMQSVMGWTDLTVDGMIEAGTRVATLLHAFNIREGFKPSDFAMPRRAAGDPQFTVGPFANRTIDFEVLKKGYYDAMGFDYETGTISEERLAKLGLDRLVKQCPPGGSL